MVMFLVAFATGMVGLVAGGVITLLSIEAEILRKGKVKIINRVYTTQAIKEKK